jgi:pimeloyl-ACP methyl ester carboxylesterase
VILFDNAGVSSSSGQVPGTFAEMAANAIAFIRALGLSEVDVLGFSIGGLVAQGVTLQALDLVRRLVLVGTGPRSGESMDTGTPSSALLTTIPTISGFASSSRPRRRAGQQAASSSSVFVSAVRTAIPR